MKKTLIAQAAKTAFAIAPTAKDLPKIGAGSFVSDCTAFVRTYN